MRIEQLEAALNQEREKKMQSEKLLAQQAEETEGRCKRHQETFYLEFSKIKKFKLAFNFFKCHAIYIAFLLWV